MTNYMYQIWDNIEMKVIGTYHTHNEAKKEIERLIQKNNPWEEYCFEIKKVNQNKQK